jgi:hypothetical protein
VHYVTGTVRSYHASALVRAGLQNGVNVGIPGTEAQLPIGHILQLSASLAAGTSVSLRDTVTGLDHDNTASQTSRRHPPCNRKTTRGR